MLCALRVLSKLRKKMCFASIARSGGVQVVAVRCRQQVRGQPSNPCPSNHTDEYVYRVEKRRLL